MKQTKCSIHCSNQIDKTSIDEQDPTIEESEIVEDLISLLVTGLDICQDEHRETIEDDRIRLGSLSTDRNFKKSNDGSLETSRIKVLNPDQQQKLEDNIDEDQKPTADSEPLKSPSFPDSNTRVLNPLDIENTKVVHTEASGRVDAYDQHSIHCSSDIKNSVVHSKRLHIKSALRGNHDELKLGPRPKHHVKWAPDVREPACTSVSHTVNHNGLLHRPKQREHRHRHKGKSKHGDASKNHDKKHSYKSRFTSQASLLRAQYHYMRYVRDWHLMGCLEPSDDGCIENSSTVITGLPESESSIFHNWSPARKGVVDSGVEQKNCTDSTVSDDQGALNVDFQLRKDSKCTGSFWGIGGLQYKLLYGEAM
eukprot:c29004_g1_i1 orf=198-1295(-)